MKKMIIFAMLITAFLVSGCSVEIETSSSKSEKFASNAEVLGDTFDNTKDILEPLKGKQILSTEDQKLITQQIDELKKVLDDFKAEEAPFLAEMAKKITLKQLNEKEKILLSIQEKAEKGNAKVKDVEEVIEAISADFEISLFGK
jgi:hypothetical protein